MIFYLAESQTVRGGKRKKQPRGERKKRLNRVHFILQEKFKKRLKPRKSSGQREKSGNHEIPSKRNAPLNSALVEALPSTKRRCKEQKGKRRN